MYVFSLRSNVSQMKYEKLSEQQCMFMVLRNFRRESGINFQNILTEDYFDKTGNSIDDQL